MVKIALYTAKQSKMASIYSREIQDITSNLLISFSGTPVECTNRRSEVQPEYLLLDCALEAITMISFQAHLCYL